MRRDDVPGRVPALVLGLLRVRVDVPKCSIPAVVLGLMGVRFGVLTCSIPAIALGLMGVRFGVPTCSIPAVVLGLLGVRVDVPGRVPARVRLQLLEESLAPGAVLPHPLHLLLHWGGGTCK